MKLLKPNYKNSIVNIPNSILKYYDLKAYNDTLECLDKYLSSKKYKNVVYITFDGMGSLIIDKHLKKTDFLIKNRIAKITSVFPSTTGAAIPSLRSGLTPREHGWLSWSCYFKEYNRFVEFFSHKDYYTKEKIEVPQDFMKYETIFEKINKKVMIYEIFPSFDAINGVENVEIALDKVGKLCNTKEEKFIHLYWDNPDLILHKTGCSSEETDEFLKMINDKLVKITKNLKDTIFIITADHGMIDIPPQNIINLNEIHGLEDCLIMPPSFKGNHYSFFVKYEKRKLFRELFRKYFKDDFLLVGKENYINNYLGIGKIHPRVDDFIGDFILISKNNKMLFYKTLNMPFKEPNVASHGGITEQEMLCPLIVYSC
jgi:hypothetical protein